MELREELWFVQLGKATALALESSTALWQALCVQIEQRLLAGDQVELQPLGILSLEQRAEYIARLPLGEMFLMPPRLMLHIQPLSTAGAVTRLTPLSALESALALATSVRSEAVGRYLEAIAPLIQEHIDRAERLSMPGLGDLDTEVAHQAQSPRLCLHIADTLACALNRPFGIFTPVELSDASAQSELEICELETLPDLDRGYIVYLCEDNTESQAAPVESSPSSQAPTEHLPMEVESVPSEGAGAEAASSPEIDTIDSAACAHEAVETDSLVEPASTSASDPEDPLPAVSGPSEGKLPKLSLWSKTLAVSLVLGVLLAVYYRYGTPRKVTQDYSPQIARTEPPGGSASKIQGGAPTEPSDTLSANAQQVASSQAVQAAQDASVATSLAERGETIVLSKGDRLTRIAKQKYGNKVFWVYIYKHNKDIIKNPNNIPIGTSLTLPPASLYNIDAHDTNSLARALELENSIWLHKGQLQ